MELNEAKRLIARYVGGGFVAESDVRRALEVTRRDPAALRRTLGVEWLKPEDDASCRELEHVVDEYADASEHLRGERFPELHAHVATCGRCLALLEDFAEQHTPAASAEWLETAVAHSIDFAVQWKHAAGIHLRGLLEDVLELVAPTPAPLPAYSPMDEFALSNKSWRFEHAETSMGISVDLLRRSSTAPVRLRVAAVPPVEGALPTIVLIERATLRTEQSSTDVLEVDLSGGQWTARVIWNQKAWDVDIDVDAQSAAPARDAGHAPAKRSARAPARIEVRRPAPAVSLHAAFVTTGRPAIQFAPGSSPDGTVPPSLHVSVSLTTLKSRLAAVAHAMQDLMQLAVTGRPRGRLCVLEAAEQLARAVLPAEGSFASLVAPGSDVVLSADETTYGIPFEMLADNYYVCPRGHVQLARGDGSERYCSLDGAQMESRSERLGIGRTLSFAVRPVTPPAPAGNVFVMIIDPRGDLLYSSDPARRATVERADALWRELQALLQQRYKVELIQGSAATVQRIRHEIRRSDLAGIYYFGHGFIDRSDEEGCLALHDFAMNSMDIEACTPSAPLVFLNACWAAAPNTDRIFRSVSHAFAMGPRKSVIGSLWPLDRLQAALGALAFFRALFAGAAVGDALRQTRRESFERYQSGEPDIAWASYRLLGELGAIAVDDPDDPLFGPGGKLNYERFQFDFDEVVAAATRRRNLQGRRRVSVEDLVSGFLRKGDLLRYLCKNLEQNPDDIRRWAEVRELGPADPLLVESERTAVAELAAHERRDRWQLPVRDEFEPAMCEILDATDKRVRPGLISERDLLVSLFQAKRRPPSGIPSLEEKLFPDGPRVAERLARAVGRHIDANGCVVLDRLDASARRIVRTAHALAQQRGAMPIPAQLFLAAFLEQGQGLTAHKWRARFGSRSEWRQRLISMVEQKNAGASFALSFEACEHVVLPALERAELEAVKRGSSTVDEALLFEAFAYTAPADLQLPEPLPEIARHFAAMEVPSGATEPSARGEAARQAASVTLDLERFDAPARAALSDALEVARRRGSDVLSSPHFLVALIGSSATPLGERLRAMGFSPQALELHMLELVPKPRVDEILDEPVPSPHVQRILQSAHTFALGWGRATSLDDLICAFVDDVTSSTGHGTAVAKLLRRIGVDAWKLRGGS